VPYRLGMSETTTPPPVTYELDGAVAVVRMDDGKANAVSHEVVALLDQAIDRAADDGARAVVLVGRPGKFSAGFDLATMRSGLDEARDLLRVGLQLSLRLFELPAPVVAACTGHALAMGAILLLSSDLRIGAEGPFKVGLNEVAIGMPVPSSVVELARARLAPGHLTRAVNLAEVYDPEGAVAAGYLDELVAADEVEATAVARAHGLADALSHSAFAATRAHLRGALAADLRGRLHEDVTTFTVDA
jgi:enoyl-CoA hydratase